jgi:hypothetical protein
VLTSKILQRRQITVSGGIFVPLTVAFLESCSLMNRDGRAPCSKSCVMNVLQNLITSSQNDKSQRVAHFPLAKYWLCLGPWDNQSKQSNNRLLHKVMRASVNGEAIVLEYLAGPYNGWHMDLLCISSTKDPPEFDL